MPYLTSTGSMFAILFPTKKGSSIFAQQAITAGIVILLLTLMLVPLRGPMSSIVCLAIPELP